MGVLKPRALASSKSNLGRQKPTAQKLAVPPMNIMTEYTLVDEGVVGSPKAHNTGTAGMTKSTPGK